MPEYVLAALEQAGVRGDYDERPAFQRNDYLRWIASAKTLETRERRIGQMLDELDRGGIYMGMTHRPSRKTDE
ncbi:YdeI/OmpD-associated family protein [Ornithinimicrobium panacihumi]|uniref:YdeI/OmpD-associated family protein n=1 Tax=Ornithinimicrobium panacihumi TaxID=2008449 RepID=UPI003F8CE42B